MCPVKFLGCSFAHDSLFNHVSAVWLNSEYWVGFFFFLLNAQAWHLILEQRTLPACINCMCWLHYCMQHTGVLNGKRHKSCASANLQRNREIFYS